MRSKLVWSLAVYGGGTPPLNENKSMVDFTTLSASLCNQWMITKPPLQFIRSIAWRGAWVWEWGSKARWGRPSGSRRETKERDLENLRDGEKWKRSINVSPILTRGRGLRTHTWKFARGKVHEARNLVEIVVKNLYWNRILFSDHYFKMDPLKRGLSLSEGIKQDFRYVCVPKSPLCYHVPTRTL